MNLDGIRNYLLSTVPGVIVLGAIGSIAAAILIRVSRSLWKRIVDFFFNRTFNWICKYLRPAAEARLLASYFVSEKDYFGFITFLGFMLMSCLGSLLFVLVSFLLLCIYFMINGMSINIWLGILSFSFFLTFYFFIKEMLCLVAVLQETKVELKQKWAREYMEKKGVRAWAEFALGPEDKKTNPKN